MFFDAYPLFYDTSETATSRIRLHLRHLAMIESNRDILAGARVLDLASHDGRWSFAALKAGAAHVTGIEAREGLVENANRTFAEYGVDSSDYSFVRGDMFDVMETTRFDVDVVLCLGFMYHTLRYPELLHGITQTQPQYCVVDTKIIDASEPTVRLLENRTDVQANAVQDKWSHGSTVLAGWPSLPALQMMLDAYDLEVERQVDWQQLLAEQESKPSGVHDYRSGSRVTLRCRYARGDAAS